LKCRKTATASSTTKDVKVPRDDTVEAVQTHHNLGVVDGAVRVLVVDEPQV
jgi:hypothetical protein